MTALPADCLWFLAQKILFLLPRKKRHFEPIGIKPAGTAALEFPFSLCSHAAMTVFLRSQRAQAIFEGREPSTERDDDYAVIDGIRFGRIYKSKLPAGDRWCWFLNGAVTAIPPGIRGSGACETLDQAKAEIVAEYGKVCERR
jgi:hypothetical protein